MAQTIGDSFDDVEDSKGAAAVSQSAHSIERALEDITPEQEYFIGRAVGANLLTNYRIYDENPNLTIYLNQITAAIVINSSKPEIYNGYHTAILDSDEINAFATPGGHIFITRGLLDCAKSEDALAAIIAHEIAHIQLHHSIQTIKSSRVKAAIMEAGSSFAELSPAKLTYFIDSLSEAAGEIVTTLGKGYPPHLEFEADIRALDLLAGAGYEPSSLLTMLLALEQNQPRHPGGFNQTHPTPEDRIANVQSPLRQYRDKVRDTRSYRENRFTTLK
jgi:predicted Zn-dependent protease